MSYLEERAVAAEQDLIVDDFDREVVLRAQRDRPRLTIDGLERKCGVSGRRCVALAAREHEYNRSHSHSHSHLSVMPKSSGGVSFAAARGRPLASCFSH